MVALLFVPVLSVSMLWIGMPYPFVVRYGLAPHAPHSSY